AHRLSHARLRLDGGELPAADGAHRGALRIRSLGQRADHDVAVGQNAEEPLVLEDEDVADVVATHDLGRLEYRGGRRDDAGIRARAVFDDEVHGASSSSVTGGNRALGVTAGLLQWPARMG